MNRTELKLGPATKWADTNMVSSKNFRLLYSKAHINFVAGLGSWLGCYHEYGTYVATFHTYLEIPWSQLDQN